MDLGIAGKRAVVAAGTAGLGYGAAAALVAEGARVAICGRDEQRGRDAVARLGGDAIALVCDLTHADAAEQFVRDATEQLGGCDILVANAGGPPGGNFASTDLDAYRYALELNCLSSIAMCRTAIPGMRSQRLGPRSSRSRRSVPSSRSAA